ncbi:MAG: SIR2 family protein [Dehalococcoidia bacterium]|nr:SIR2 family protein [Dehalococcoidia bacterium]
MSIELSKVKKMLQDHLQEGLLLVVGTGLSMAEGIPGMRELSDHLKATIPPKLLLYPDSGWDDVVVALDSGDHLEAAMGRVTLKSTTVEAIIEETTKLVLVAERKVFKDVLNGKRVLPFTHFAKHLFKAANKFHLITPNYDRLIEIAVEAADIGVDSRFAGYLLGRTNPKQSADAHRESYINGRNKSFRLLPCLCIYKPHGSLDWYEMNGKVVRCPIDIGKVPIVITPGASKYKESFRWAFDDQRTSGNRIASTVTRLMFIGYGFNDDHLEQYLCPDFKTTRPSVILAKELTNNAIKVITNSKGTDVVALCAVSKTDLRTKIVTSLGEELIVNEQLWNLEGFNKGVL